MTDTNAILDLPSGARCVRIEEETRRYVFSVSGATLTADDIEALYADAISADGGHALRREQGEACANLRRYRNPESAFRGARDRGLGSGDVRGCGVCGGYHVRGGVR